MSLSSSAVKAIKNAMADKDIGQEVADAIDADGSGPAANVSNLQENGGAIGGGAPDSSFADLTASYVARTGSNSGTADGALQAEGSLATAGGNTYSDAAVNTILVKIENNIAEVLAVVAQLAADDIALRDAARENANKINAILSSLQAAGLMS